MLTKEQTILAELADEPVPVTGDERRLEQVILNLLTNAIYHASESPRIDVRLSCADEQVTLDVQDYGPGIAPDSMVGAAVVNSVGTSLPADAARAPGGET